MCSLRVAVSFFILIFSAAEERRRTAWTPKSGSRQSRRTPADAADDAAGIAVDRPLPVAVPVTIGAVGLHDAELERLGRLIDAVNRRPGDDAIARVASYQWRRASAASAHTDAEVATSANTGAEVTTSASTGAGVTTSANMGAGGTTSASAGSEVTTSASTGAEVDPYPLSVPRISVNVSAAPREPRVDDYNPGRSDWTAADDENESDSGSEGGDTRQFEPRAGEI
jgi:hypothetical protein